MKTQTRSKRGETISQDGTDFSFSSTPLYADKDEYLAKNLTFSIRSIEFQEGRGYETGTDRWAVTVSMDGRPEEILTFSCNEKRDAQLKTAQDFLAHRGPIPNVRLKKAGKAYYFENAGPQGS